MNCSQFQEILHDLDRPGTKGFAARDAAFLHAESCDHCTQLLTQSESLDFALHTLREREAHRRMSPRIEELLLEEFRRRNVTPSRRRVPWPVAALATAATLLLALGLALHYWTAHRVAGTTAKNSTGSSDAEKIANNGPSTSTPSEDRAAAEEKPAGDSESVTAFVPLPYADDSLAGEGGAIVRVVLSRPALASLGLPVADIGATDRIPADIIVSEDGAPQAIRLVAQSALE
jgi:hypothetical protein